VAARKATGSAPSKAARPTAVGVSGKPSSDTPTRSQKAPGQGPGPRLAGSSGDISAAVPSRVLTTRVVRRASSVASGPIQHTRLVDYSRGFGAK